MQARAYSFVSVCLLFTVLIKGERDEIISSSSDGIYKEEIEIVEAYNELLTHNETFFQEFNVRFKQFSDKTPKFTMTCSLEKEVKLTTKSVHQLRPQDIRVVGALGDSITKAIGAKSRNVLELLMEYIGISWSIGGDKTLSEFVTLPNILKEYNGGQLRGYSLGQYIYFPGIYIGDHLNVAKSAGKARDMPYQAELLVKRIKKDKKIDFFLDWKMITLFIGGNDVCDCCIDKKRYSPENFKNYIQEALDILYKELPRAYINVVLVPNVVQLREVIKHVALCSVLHIIECKCVRLANDAGLKEIEKTTFAYQDLVYDMVYSGRYSNREDFTVEIQPFLKETSVPYDHKGNPDMSYFAPDCFHFSVKGHQELAIALWNNMFEPVNKKTNFMRFGQNMTCPTKENPYFATWKNSMPSTTTQLLPSLENSHFLAKVGNRPTHNSLSRKLVKPEENTFSSPNNKIFQFSLIGIALLVASILIVAGIVLLRHKLLHKQLHLFKGDAHIIPVVTKETGPKF